MSMISIRDHVPRTPKDEKLEALVAPIVAMVKAHDARAREEFKRLVDGAKAYLSDHYNWTIMELKGYGF